MELNRIHKYLIITFGVSICVLVLIAFQRKFASSAQPAAPSPAASTPTKSPSPTHVPYIEPTTGPLISPPLPVGYSWSEVPSSQMVSNKNILSWVVDLRECQPGPGTAKDNCKYPEKYYHGYSTLPGKEWVAYRKVAKSGEDYGYNQALSFMVSYAKQINWSLSGFSPQPHYTFNPVQGLQSAVYQPTCIQSVRDSQARVACFTKYIAKSSTTGDGMTLRFIYPYTEEYRFFVSDIVSISTLLSQLQLRQYK